LGYDLNTVEFACEDGVPYAIDFMNPAPDADIHSVGEDNFHWIVDAVAELAVRKAKEHTGKVSEYRWSTFLSGLPASGEADTTPKAAKAVKAPKSATKG
jgi:hypothetical protein